MVTVPDIPRLEVAAGSGLTSEVVTYTFTLEIQTKLVAGDIVIIDFPDEVIAPDTAVCAAVQVVATISC